MPFVNSISGTAVQPKMAAEVCLLSVQLQTQGIIHSIGLTFVNEVRGSDS